MPRCERFAIATRDELWVRGKILESRRETGEALQSGNEIVAQTSLDPRLDDAADRELERARAARAELGDARMRIVVRAEAWRGPITVEATITVTLGGVTIVTTPDLAAADVAALRKATERPVDSSTVPRLPIVWSGGSAAVLFHEVAGHAAEERCSPIEWPRWLRVIDDATTDLLAGEMPQTVRRGSFRDVPLHRLRSVVVSQTDAPFSLPPERIEIRYIAGGAFDALGESVVLDIAVAEHVDGDVRRRLPPFELRSTRRRVAAGLAGASGGPLRYPGVICSREGQELVVGSFAPVIVTSSLG